MTIRLARRRRIAALKQPADGPKSRHEATFRPIGGCCGWRRLVLWSSGRVGWRRTVAPRRRPYPGCGSRSSTSARATRSCCSRRARRRCWSTAARPATISPRKLEAAGVERLGAAIVTHDQSDHAGGIEELLGRFPIARLVYARLGRRLLDAAAGRRRRPDAGRRAAASCARAACASRFSGRRRELLAEPARRHRPEPAGAGPARPLATTSRCCSPPTPRRRPCRSTPARSTCSRSPTTAATTPASAALLDRIRPRAGGDLGRRRQPLRAPDRRQRWRPLPRTASAPCAPTTTGRSHRRRPRLDPVARAAERLRQVDA